MCNKRKAGITYVVSDAHNPGRYKIGETKHTSSGRYMPTNTFLSDDPLAMVIEFHNNRCWKLEQATHKVLKRMGKHVVDEWFAADIDLVVKVLTEQAARLKLKYTVVHGTHKTSVDLHHSNPAIRREAMVKAKAAMDKEHWNAEKKAERLAKWEASRPHPNCRSNPPLLPATHTRGWKHPNAHLWIK